MKPGLISVIVPAYNAEKYLAEALDSIFGQDYPDQEVIVVDDGSTDGTAAVARSYPQVRYVWQHNQGNGVAWNTGLAHAAGELISFLDADDVWLPGKQSMEAEFLAGHPESGCVLAAMRNFLQPDAAQPAWVSDEMLRQDFKAYSLGTLMAHRWVFEQIGNLNPTMAFGCDMDWFIRLIESGISFTRLSGVLLRRRIHATNMTTNNTLPEQHRVRILKRSLDRRRAKAAHLNAAVSG
jgi:glycosyltransferase involved in cell wall biosynthesis